MARNLFTTNVTGNKDILGDLGRLVEEFPAWSREALKAQEQVVEDAIRNNWVSRAGGQAGDYVFDSVGHSAEIGENRMDVVGTVGVYNIDSIALSHGKVAEEGKRKPMNAAQIAYWVEFGTSRLKSGTRKVKGAEYDEEELIVQQPKQFISPAFYETIDEQQAAYYAKFNQILNRMLK